MKKLIYLFLFVSVPVAMKAQDAASILKKTTEAYGGSAWDTVNYIRMHYFGHQHWLEQSENPQGPFIVSYFDTEEIRSSRDKKLYQKTETKMMQSPKPSTRVDVLVDTVGYMAFGERKFPMNYSFREENNRWLQYAPEYLLQQARMSNAKLDKILELEGVNHYQLSFSKDKIGYSLFINASTFLISEAHIDTYSPNEFFFFVVGQVHNTRSVYFICTS